MKDYIFYLFVIIALGSVAFTSEKKSFIPSETETILKYLNINPQLNTRNYFYQTIKKTKQEDSISRTCHSIRGTENIAIPLINSAELTLPIVSKTVNIYPFNLINWQREEEIYLTGEGINIPRRPCPGQKLPDGSFCFTSGYVKAYVNITDRKVTAYERIKIAAGRYDCFKVKEKHLVTTLGLCNCYTVDSWYTPSLGLIKSVSYNTEGECINIQQLEAVRYEKVSPSPFPVE